MDACNIKKEELTAYCYGELNQERIEKIKKHLVGCVQCADEVGQLEKTLLLVKQQKLKKIPPEILGNYVQEIREQLAKQEEQGFISELKEKLLAWLDNLRLGFYPQLAPALAALCVVIFVFAFMRYNKINTVNLVNQDIALLDTLGENADDVYFSSDEAQLAEAIEDSDRILLAQLGPSLERTGKTLPLGLDSDIESGQALEDMEILQELEIEETIDNEEEILDYLNILDEIATEPSVG